jgi:NADH dehydrogenase [ubiquinone] 1 alpha subcomplex assembly factor 7
VSTPLARQIACLIAAQGPITLAQFMAAALADPRHGYYVRQDPIGRSGDFITAPEISQMFGELIGLWCAHGWELMGRPTPLRLVELGPGRGVMMADMLRAARVLPSLIDALDLHLVEINPGLRTRQREAIDLPATWHERLDTVPPGPLLLVANEFLDALPIRQFQRLPDGWHERAIALVEEASLEAPRFRFALAPAPVPAALLPPEAADAPMGAIAELCPAAAALAEAVAARLVDRGGYALFLDYGRRGCLGDSLQAMRGHRFHDALADPGAADLTAHVDFAALARAASRLGALTAGPVPQGTFLRRLGIAARAEALRRSATPEQARDIESALHRLTAPEQMGSLFQAFALHPPHLPRPPGFEEGG